LQGGRQKQNKNKNPLQISNETNIDHTNALTMQEMFLLRLNHGGWTR